MIKALLIDSDQTRAEQLERALDRRGMITTHAATIHEAVRKLKARAASFDLVILCMTDPSKQWMHILHELQQAAWRSGTSVRPLFLCISRLSMGAEFQLRIENMGARYAVDR